MSDLFESWWQAPPNAKDKRVKYSQQHDVSNKCTIHTIHCIYKNLRNYNYFCTHVLKRSKSSGVATWPHLFEIEGRAPRA